MSTYGPRPRRGIPACARHAVRSRVRCAASGVSFSTKDVDVGLEVDLGSLSQTPKLVGNAFPMHELALSAHTFGAKEAHRLLGLVS